MDTESGMRIKMRQFGLESTICDLERDMMFKHGKLPSSNFLSVIKIDGVPILPPVVRIFSHFLYPHAFKSLYYLKRPLVPWFPTYLQSIWAFLHKFHQWLCLGSFCARQTRGHVFPIAHTIVAIVILPHPTCNLSL